MRWSEATLMLTATLALAGCAPSSDFQQLQGTQQSLRQMVADDRQQIDALKEKLARDDDKIAELEQGGGQSDQLKELQDRVKKLEGPGASAAPSAEATPGAEASPAAGSAPGEGTPAEPPSDTAATAPPSAPSNAPAAVQAPMTWQQAAASELGGNQTDAGAKQYRAGLAAMKAGKYAPALVKFQDLQRRYPKSALSEPAEYFAGNALFEQGQYDRAILQFNDLNQRFPEGRFASAALWCEAQAFLKINDPVDARLTLRKLVNDHPDTPEAAAAKPLMASLSS